MAQKRGGLGRGLDSLIRDDGRRDGPDVSAARSAPVGDGNTESAGSAEAGVSRLRIGQVTPNREQPRKEFDAEKISELAESIRQFGVITPILVQRKGTFYEIIAGERRWRAAKEAGLREIPAIVREYSPQEAVEVSLIENIQREDLSPIEEAQAYDRLIRDFSLTQEAVAKRVSKSRSAVTNTMRLLGLPQEVQEMVSAEDISEGHARALLSLPSPTAQIETARRVAKENLSVRETEKIVRQIVHPSSRRARPESNAVDELIYKDLEEQLRSALGTRVSVIPRGKERGRIEIEYYSVPELERILDLLREAGRAGEGGS